MNLVFFQEWRQITVEKHDVQIEKIRENIKWKRELCRINERSEFFSFYASYIEILFILVYVTVWQVIKNMYHFLFVKVSLKRFFYFSHLCYITFVELSTIYTQVCHHIAISLLLHHYNSMNVSLFSEL